MLSLHNIAVDFGDRPVLSSISLEIRPGDRLALLGASGAGKTTLLRVLAGLLRPSAGEIRLDDHPYWLDAKRPSLHIWPTITLVFQDIRLFPNLSARQNCMLGLDDSSVDELESLSRTLKVTHCLDRRPSTLSQGEQQRVAIIRALLRAPRYLLLDEPTSALDEESRSILSDLIIERQRKQAAVVFVTHDLMLASQLANRVIVLRDGHLTKGATELKRLATIEGGERDGSDRHG